MANQKIENLLNLALDASNQEREKSEILEVGYEPADQEWELIIKYSGNLENVRVIATQVTELLNQYAIVRIAESRIQELAQLQQVEYIEKPKRLYFQVLNGKRVSCINPVQDTRLGLFGAGVIVAVVDSGINYELDDFRNSDGTTRILYLWDQEQGQEYSSEEINLALAENRRISQDISGHGTAVAGIAAGSGRYTGVAPESDLIVVKIGKPMEGGFPRTTELMEGVDYVVRKSIELGKPAAINLSFGNSYGAHNGQSLVERYLDDVAGLGKVCICVGSGNEGRGAGHVMEKLESGQSRDIQLAVQERETGLNIQIWKSYTDELQIQLISPAGVVVGPVSEVLGSQRFTVGDTDILLYYGEPSPYSVSQEIFFDFIPRENFVSSGIWTIRLIAGNVVDGQVDLWLPVENALNQGTGFVRPTKEDTITIPATANRVITVGAYDALTFTYADFSGRGTEGNGKPDLVAPGVNVMTISARGTYERVTGTSFATPFVTGSCALLMEWGVIRGNDPYLYGEKVKAYLRRGAKQLPGYDFWPNPIVGYGALCVRDSLPI